MSTVPTNMQQLSCPDTCQACRFEHLRSWVAGQLVKHEKLGLGKVTNVTSAGVTVWFVYYVPGLVFELDTKELEPVHSSAVRVLFDLPPEDHDFIDPPIIL